MIPIEQRVLACSTVLNADPDHKQRLQHLMSRVRNKDFLIDTAIKEGLACLLYKNLLNSGVLKTLGREQIDKLESCYYETVIRNLKLTHDLNQVLRQLSQKKIQVVLLQGIILLEQVYDDVGLRPMTDMDLWVSEKDYPDVIRILSDYGYQRDQLYPNTLRKGSTVLDLHTHILWADRIKARALLLERSQDHILHDARTIDFEGQEVKCLSRYDQMLYLGLHALKHKVDKLLWLVDIGHLVAHWQTSDWEALLNRARDLGQEKSVLYILYLLSNLFAFHPPHETDRLAEGKGLSCLEKKVLEQRMKKDSLPLWAPLLLLSTGKGWKTRSSFLLENMFPRPEILRQIFPNSPDLKIWQLYVMRAVQLLGKIRPA